MGMSCCTPSTGFGVSTGSLSRSTNCHHWTMKRVKRWNIAMKLAKVITTNGAMKICITRDITGEQFVCYVVFGKDPEIMCVVFEFHPERDNDGSFYSPFCF